MRIYVSQEFLDYLTAYYWQAHRGDENYCAEFDVNNDGIIDVTDVAWFSQRYGTWVDIGGPNIVLIAATGFIGLGLGYALSRIL